jgi:hypothetical protein
MPLGRRTIEACDHTSSRLSQHGASSWLNPAPTEHRLQPHRGFAHAAGRSVSGEDNAANQPDGKGISPLPHRKRLCHERGSCSALICELG